MSTSKKKPFLISAIILVIICAIIAGVVIIKNKNQSTELKYMVMSDSQIADLFYDAPADNLANNSTLNCRYFGTVGSSEEALEEAKKVGIGEKEELLELSIKGETDYYYIVHQKYISHRGTSDVEFTNSLLYLKKDVFNASDKTINLKVLNKSNKIKEAFDTYLYTRNRDLGSIKLLSSSIEENTDNYIYTYYYFNTSFGDYGLSDNIKLYEEKISINKQTGKYDSEANMLRNVTGKMNKEGYDIVF